MRGKNHLKIRTQVLDIGNFSGRWVFFWTLGIFLDVGNLWMFVWMFLDILDIFKNFPIFFPAICSAENFYESYPAITVLDASSWRSIEERLHILLRGVSWFHSPAASYNKVQVQSTGGMFKLSRAA